MKKLPLLFLVIATVGKAPQAKADTTCTIITHPTMEFGIVDPQNSAKRSQGALSFRCANNNWLYRSQVTLCAGMGADLLGSTDPRHLYRIGGNSLDDNDKMAYNIFTDAAETRIWGNIREGEEEMFKTRFTIAAGTSMTGTVNLYGRIFPRQDQLRPGAYRYVARSALTRLYFSFFDNGETSPPASCLGPNHKEVPFTAVLNATVEAKCAINRADDLNFGVVTGLPRDRVNGQSQLEITCTNGTPYTLALDNGLHFSGEQRRMSAGDSRFVSYELYRDNARTHRWGGREAVDRLTGIGSGLREAVAIYGQVPAQPQVAAGDYSDTITATIAY